MPRYVDDYSRGRSRHDRDRSPDYQYAGGTGSSAPPYPPSEDTYGTRIPSPGRKQYNPPSESQARLAYEPQTPFYSPPPSNNNQLQVPDSQSRPRSLPPPVGWRGRSRHGRGYRDDSEERDRSPISRAKHVVKDNFTDSTTGLGVGILGALVGGLAAREASEATSKHSGHGRQTEAEKRTQLLSTVVGAAVGALGANAVEKRLELNWEKSERREERWERKYRAHSRGSLGYMSGGNGSAEIIEKREIITRPRSSRRHSGGWKNDWDLNGKDGVIKREVDTNARSWRNVEDWVYDDRHSRDGWERGKRNDDRHRH